MDVGLQLEYAKLAVLQSKPRTVLYIQYISEFCIRHSHGSLYLCMYVCMVYMCVLSKFSDTFSFVFKDSHAFHTVVFLLYKEGMCMSLQLSLFQCSAVPRREVVV